MLRAATTRPHTHPLMGAPVTLRDVSELSRGRRSGRDSMRHKLQPGPAPKAPGVGYKCDLAQGCRAHDSRLLHVPALRCCACHAPPPLRVRRPVRLNSCTPPTPRTHACGTPPGSLLRALTRSSVQQRGGAPARRRHRRRVCLRLRERQAAAAAGTILQRHTHGQAGAWCCSGGCSSDVAVEMFCQGLSRVACVVKCMPQLCECSAAS
jgi:hypothetical protein